VSDVDIADDYGKRVQMTYTVPVVFVPETCIWNLANMGALTPIAAERMAAGRIAKPRLNVSEKGAAQKNRRGPSSDPNLYYEI
jgi:hypothetical protein